MLFKCISKQVHLFYFLADMVFSESHSNRLIKRLAETPCTDPEEKKNIQTESQSQWLFKMPQHLVWIKYTYAEIMDVRYFIF